MRRVRSSSGFVTIGTAVALFGIIVGILTGAGSSQSLFNLGNGFAWLSSNGRGEATLVNGATGEGSAGLPIKNAAGGKMDIVQRDGHAYVVVHKRGLDTLYRLDDTLATAGNGVPIASDQQIIRGGDVAYLVATQQGTAQQIDPESLKSVGKRIDFRSPGAQRTTIEADADDAGRLVVVVPSRGQAYVVSDGAKGRGITVGQPNNTFSLTVSAGVPAVVNSSTFTLTAFAEGEPTTVGLPFREGRLLIPSVGSSRLTTVVAVNGSTVSLGLIDAANRTAKSVILPLHSSNLQPPLATPDAIFLPDPGERQVVVMDALGAIRSRVSVNPDVFGSQPYQTFVKDGMIWLNDPNGQDADVIDGQGIARHVRKYDAPSLDKKIKRPPTLDTKSKAPPSRVPAPAPAPVATVAPPPPAITVTAPPPPVATPPGPPTKFTAVAGNRSVDLSWIAPGSSGAPPDSYTLTCSPDCGAGRPSISLVGTRQSETVGKLTNGTTYTFELKAQNSVGTGPAASAGPATPTGDVPDAPTNVTAIASNTGTVTVSWLENPQNLVIAGYTVIATTTDANITPSSTPFSVAAGKFQFVTPVGKLGYDVGGPGYTFTVAAQATKNGRPANSQPSQPSLNVRPQREAEFPVGARVTVTAADGSISLSWPDADPHGSAVTYWVCSKTPCDKISTGSATTASITTNLVNGTTYQLSVRATNAADLDGTRTTPLFATATPHIPPTIPPSISAAPTGMKNGTVTFSVDTHGELGITCELTSPESQSGSCSSYLFGNIQPYINSTVTVCAANPQGDRTCASTNVSGANPPSLVERVIAPTLQPYTNWAIRSGTAKNTAQRGTAYIGDSATVYCWRHGTNPYGSSDVWYYVNDRGISGWISDGFYVGIGNGVLDSRLTSICPPGA